MHKSAIQGPLTTFPPSSQTPAEQVKTAFNQTSGEIVEADVNHRAYKS
jgi:hypothetical protein